MKSNNKIQAFTLSEMIVVLILTSIVIGLAFSVLSLVQKHITGIQSNFIHNTEINKLEQSLWIDFNRYTKIEYDALQDEIKFSNHIDSLHYQFHETYIIKNRDTLNIQLQNKLFFFDGDIIESGLIDAIKLQTSKLFQSQKLFVFKKNDATPFIN
ncbi:prepilin-type N-terminal cleavage/methylation domain-containing protein [Flavivirga amylovorans]|uniref:Prepilin-type N-terminal cleavage/methylation domain-containing protein n=1 Tax=Flavivirga amylovorans TaxID=870486 RepID=A0ABT8WXB3_9FLAO|nr:prepilin-type N-terminal cleavage/methylation domain-containing protein [Flavivirga amylovorans]MDO5986300.1 prepilin-type N-terminal cleavage/methylation domain-containing protein [Flavivirga amylovorans]